MQPEVIADYYCQCGENPLWHPSEQRLYWIDIDLGRLFWYEPATGRHQMCFEGEVIGGFTLQADGALLLFMARGAVKVWRDGNLAETLIDEIPDERDSRFNDVIADPAGRVFCGTMSTPDRLGRLYRLDPDGALTLVVDQVGCSNGLGFTPDRKCLYHTDSHAREIYRYDYDEESGAITNRRVFVKTPEGEGGPDGMTVDAEGYVWCAKWNGSCLIRFTPEGIEERRIAFPAKKVSSVAFGGKDYTELFVTTASRGDRAIEGAGAGALFRLATGIRGVPEFRSRIKC